jgi:hypothetical protein
MPWKIVRKITPNWSKTPVAFETVSNNRDIVYAWNISALNLLNTNTWDQTTIVWITWTLEQFNSACSNADFTSLEWAETLTNKRINSRIATITSSATPTFNTDSYDAVTITELVTDITSMTSWVTWAPLNFDKLIIRIKDNWVARWITWGTLFEAKWITLPLLTTAWKVLTLWFIYDSVTTKWGLVASSLEA